MAMYNESKPGQPFKARRATTRAGMDAYKSAQPQKTPYKVYGGPAQTQGRQAAAVGQNVSRAPQGQRPAPVNTQDNASGIPPMAPAPAGSPRGSAGGAAAGGREGQGRPSGPQGSGAAGPDHQRGRHYAAGLARRGGQLHMTGSGAWQSVRYPDENKGPKNPAAWFEDAAPKSPAAWFEDGAPQGGRAPMQAQTAPGKPSPSSITRAPGGQSTYLPQTPPEMSQAGAYKPPFTPATAGQLGAVRSPAGSGGAPPPGSGLTGNMQSAARRAEVAEKTASRGPTRDAAGPEHADQSAGLEDGQPAPEAPTSSEQVTEDNWQDFEGRPDASGSTFEGQPLNRSEADLWARVNESHLYPPEDSSPDGGPLGGEQILPPDSLSEIGLEWYRDLAHLSEGDRQALIRQKFLEVVGQHRQTEQSRYRDMMLRGVQDFGFSHAQVAELHQQGFHFDEQGNITDSSGSLVNSSGQPYGNATTQPGAVESTTGIAASSGDGSNPLQGLLDQENVGQVPQGEIDAKIAAAQQTRAHEAARSMRAAMIASANAGAPAMAQASMLAGTGQNLAVQGAQQDADLRFGMAVQNAQAAQKHWSQVAQTALQIAGMTQDAQMQRYAANAHAMAQRYAAEAQRSLQEARMQHEVDMQPGFWENLFNFGGQAGVAAVTGAAA